MKRMTKVCSLILALVMITSMLSVGVAASDAISRATSTKAIVIVPGIMCSSMKNTATNTVCWGTYTSVIHAADMICTETGATVNPIESFDDDHYGTIDMYEVLYDNLEANFGDTYDVIFFDYDWRMDISTAATRLATEMNSYSEIVIVAHSMGGLVASKFLADSSVNRAKTSKLISLGTPYVGSAKSILSLEAGEVLGGVEDLVMSSVFKTLAPTFTSVYELIPTSRYLSTINGTSFLWVDSVEKTYSSAMTFLWTRDWARKANGAVKPMFSAATTFHNSLYNNNGVHVIDYSGVDVYTLSGTGELTTAIISFVDGEVDRTYYSNAGDGTVLASSAGHGTPDYTYSTDHKTLVEYDYAVWDVLNIIAGTEGWRSRSNANTLLLNEKGWIAGKSDNRVEVLVRGNHDLQIRDDEGNELVVNGDCIIKETATGNEKVGDVWRLNERGDVQYVLCDDNYDFSINFAEKRADNAIEVNYLRDGYFTSSTEYSDINYECLSINISDYANSGVSCIGIGRASSALEKASSGSEITPTVVRQGADLVV